MLTSTLPVLMMAECCLLAESMICYPPLYDELRLTTPRPTETTETVAVAAVGAALEQNASAIIVLSTSGNTARLISKYRPNVPIITGEYLCIQLRLHCGLTTVSSDAQRADSPSNSPSPRLLSILVP